MKHVMILFIISLLASSGLVAQSYPEALKPMSQGEKNSFTIDLKVGDVKTIEGLWVDYQKKFKAKKPKRNKKTGEYFADDAEIKGISANTIDIYSVIEPKDDKGAIITVWFDLGGAYLSSERHPDRMAGAGEWMAGFENKVMQEFAEQILAAEEDILKGLEKELSSLEKAKADKEDKIKSLEAQIQQLHGDIGNTMQAMSDKRKEIDAQKEVVEAARVKVKKGKR